MQSFPSDVSCTAVTILLNSKHWILQMYSGLQYSAQRNFKAQYHCMNVQKQRPLFSCTEIICKSASYIVIIQEEVIK